MTVFAFGSNGNGQLGLGHKEDTEEPGVVLFEDSSLSEPDAQLSLAFGGNHTLLVNKTTGKFYGSGDNKECQLGLPNQGDDKGSVSQFTELNLPLGAQPVTHIAAGWEFSVAVTSDGCIYTAGKGPKGELANGNEAIKMHRQFLKVYQFQEGQKVVQVSAGMAHVVVLLSNGDIWGWGVGRKGQLGLAPSAIVGSFVRPLKVDYLYGDDDKTSIAKSIGCGRAFTLISLGQKEETKRRVKILSNDKAMGEVISKVEELSNDQSSENYIKSVTAGWTSIHILYESGQLVSLGNNSHGQLGPEGGNVEAGVKFSSHVSGTEHSLGLSEDGKVVYAWGWGEHGNCGPMYSEERPNGQIYQVYQSKEKVIKQIYGGYASSWIIE